MLLIVFLKLEVALAVVSGGNGSGKGKVRDSGIVGWWC